MHGRYLWLCGWVLVSNMFWRCNLRKYLVHLSAKYNTVHPSPSHTKISIDPESDPCSYSTCALNGLTSRRRTFSWSCFNAARTALLLWRSLMPTCVPLHYATQLHGAHRKYTRHTPLRARVTVKLNRKIRPHGWKPRNSETRNPPQRQVCNPRC